MMASPLVHHSGFSPLDTDFGHYQAVVGVPITSPRTEQRSTFSLGCIPLCDQESTQDTISSTGRSSVADSTIATTFSDFFRNQHHHSNHRAISHTGIDSQRTGEVLSIAPRRDPFRNPKCLRKANLKVKPLYIYPCSRGEISRDYDEHFDEIVLTLKKNILRDPHIISSAGNDMLYQMLKVGSSPQDVHSAVVVVCEEEIFAHVKDTLYESRILRECNLYNPTTTQRTIFSWLKKLHGQTNHDQHQPYMPLYIYAGKPVTSLHQTLDPISTDNLDRNVEAVSDFTLCGAKIMIADQSKFATITCVMKLDEGWYGLTAAHTFRNDCTNDSQVNHKSWNSVEAKCFISHGANDQFVESSIYLPAPSFFDSMTADLDWGLVELKNDHLIMENAYMCQDTFHTRLEVTGTVAHHPRTERNVLILISALRPLTGILLDEYTYRTAIGKGTVQLWSVEVDNEQELVKGHSGSLVIDAATSEAYGYIVAIDIFGKAQVVPLCSALKQIQYWTSASDIVLGDRATIHRTQIVSRLSTYLPEQSSRLKRKNNSTELSEPSLSHKRRKISKTTNTEYLSNSGLGVRDVAERLQELQQRLHMDQCQIDKTDLDFLKTLAKSIQDHQDLCNTHELIELPDIDTDASQALSRRGNEFVPSSSKDMRQNEIGNTRSTEPHHERVCRSMSADEQHSINKLDVNCPEQIAFQAAEEQNVEMSFERFKESEVTSSQQHITEQESPITDEAVSKWAENLLNETIDPPSLDAAKHPQDLASNESEKNQPSYVDSDAPVRSLHRTVLPRISSSGILPLSIHIPKEHQPSFLEFICEFARFPSELPCQIQYDDLEKFFSSKHCQAQSIQQVNANQIPAFPVDFLDHDTVTAKFKQAIAKLYCGYQTEFPPKESTMDFKFKCTLGCSWSHEIRSQWERHEGSHYPQELWICCHQDCLVKGPRTRVSFWKDLARHHYFDHHRNEEGPDITEKRLEDIRVCVTDSMFPKDCVFEGCSKKFSTFDDRSIHIGHHLEQQHVLCMGRIIKHYFPETEDEMEMTAAPHNTREQESKSDDGSAGTYTKSSLEVGRKLVSGGTARRFSVLNKMGPPLGPQRRVQNHDPSSTGDLSRLNFIKMNDEIERQYHRLFDNNNTTSMKEQASWELLRRLVRGEQD